MNRGVRERLKTAFEVSRRKMGEEAPLVRLDSKEKSVGLSWINVLGREGKRE